MIGIDSLGSGANQRKMYNATFRSVPRADATGFLTGDAALTWLDASSLVVNRRADALTVGAPITTTRFGAYLFGDSTTNNNPGVSMVSDGGAVYTLLSSYNNSNGQTSIDLNRSRGAMTAPLPVASGDILASIFGRGYDGASFQPRGEIRFVCAGTVTTGNVPTNIIIRTGGINTQDRVIIDFNGAFLHRNNMAVGYSTLPSVPSSALAVSGGLYVGSTPTQVVGTRKTGWTTATGTATRNASSLNATTSPGLQTLLQVATDVQTIKQVLKALLDDFISHGLLGA